METHELTFIGSTPPVTIHADNCRDVVVNYRITIQAREEDSLRRWAAQIDQTTSRATVML